MGIPAHVYRGMGTSQDAHVLHSCPFVALICVHLYSSVGSIPPPCLRASVVNKNRPRQQVYLFPTPNDNSHMTVLEAIQLRRSVPRLSHPGPIPDDVMQRMRDVPSLCPLGLQHPAVAICHRHRPQPARGDRPRRQGTNVDGRRPGDHRRLRLSGRRLPANGRQRTAASISTSPSPSTT